MIGQGPGGLAAATHDICIVGAGPVGIAIALDFARLGRRVLLLESGGDGVDESAQALSDATIVDPARHDSMRIAVARRLGGTSNLWGGRCLPYDAVDFEHRPVQGDARWPIGLADIAPWYGRAVAYACAGAPVFEMSELAQGSDVFATSSLERWSRDRKAQHAHGKALAEQRADRPAAACDVSPASSGRRTASRASSPSAATASASPFPSATSSSRRAASSRRAFSSPSSVMRRRASAARTARSAVPIWAM